MAKPAMRMKPATPAASVPVFTITVTAASGAYTEGMKLTEARHIVEYFGSFITDETQARLYRQAKPEDVMNVITTAETAGLSDEDANEKRLNSIGAAKFMLVDTTDIPRTTGKLPVAGSIHAMALKYGAMVDPTTQADLSVGIKGQIDADSCPIITSLNLERQFGKLMEGNHRVIDLWPMVNTRHQPSRTKAKPKAPEGYRTPAEPKDDKAPRPVWEGSYDYYETENQSGVGPSKIYGHFVAEFTAATSDGLKWATRVTQLEACIANTVPEGGLAADIQEVKNRLDEASFKLWCQAELPEAAFQFNRRRQWYGRGLEVLQATRRIQERFAPSGVKVQLTGTRLGEANEVAARKRKPFVLVGEVKSSVDPSRMLEVVSQPQTLTFLLGLARKAHTLPENTSINVLTEKKRSTTTPPAGQAPAGALKAEIHNMGQLYDYLAAFCNFAERDGSHNELMSRVTSKDDGGMTASVIVMAAAKLGRIAENTDVQRMAKLYDERTAAELAAASQLAADKAKAEQAAKVPA